MADTLVTPGKGSAGYIPATASRLNFGLHAANLTRKVYRLSAKTAVAVSGKQPYVRDFLQAAQDYVDIFEHDERPMRRFGDLANQYAPNVHALGATLLRNLDRVSLMGAPGSWQLKNLGLSTAVGTGMEPVLKLASRYGENIQNEFIAYPLEIIRQLAGILNNSTFMKELSVGSPRSWGGFFEHMYIDPISREWRFGLSSLHIFLRVERHGGRLQFLSRDRFLAYDGEGGSGKILAVVRHNDQNFGYHWNLIDVLNSAPTIDAPAQFWDSWKPESVTITFDFAIEPTRVNRTHHTVPITQTSKFGLALGRRYGLRFDLPYLEEAAEEFLANNLGLLAS